jgi:hypothetical protein
MNKNIIKVNSFSLFHKNNFRSYGLCTETQGNYYVKYWNTKNHINYIEITNKMQPFTRIYYSSVY